MSTAVERTKTLRAGGALRATPALPRPAQDAPVRRAPLEVVGPRTRRVRRRRLAPVLSGVVVAGSLLLVVLGHAELAQGQMRLANVQAEITSAQLLHRREVLALASLENPSRILQEAEDTLHMAPPAQVHQLAHVPLGVRLPAPHVVPAAGGAPATPATAAG